jgi:DNA (cytosine-5)-methyltransferase 1
MRFIDLFAGLGGFHQALSELGHTCVFASELDSELRLLYAKNFGLLPKGDIRQIKEKNVPAHDILCAGFPCKSFSKAGKQEGFDCPESGDLFDHVMRIIHHHLPSYVMLENVPNIQKHNDGKTWQHVETSLKEAGYTIEYKRLSPHFFGIPQIRERLFIVGSRLGLDGFSFPNKPDNPRPMIHSVLDENPPNAKKISKKVEDCLNVWGHLITRFPKNIEFPYFPIWSMEFGATYPYEEMTPHVIGTKRLGYYRGNHGIKLSQIPFEDRFSHLPSHARQKVNVFPDWKVKFIRYNREFYREHKKLIDGWMPKILQFHHSLQKFEWHCKGEERNVWNFVIQLRASGVRLKRPTTAPSLVAMSMTQVPIIAWEKRYMTVRECARLQSMDNLQHLPASPTKTYMALGNAVNVQLVKMIAESLLASHEQRRKRQNGKYNILS